MFIESMNVDFFRHVREAEFGVFREPISGSELIVLAGPNGSGKSSILELLSFGLTTRYSWQYIQTRAMSEHRVGIKIGLSSEEIRLLLDENPDENISEFLRRHRGYWMEINLPESIPEKSRTTNTGVHALVSRKFQNFERKLGFFIRSDRSYAGRGYKQQNLFSWRNKLQPNYFNKISYVGTIEQYNDMYDFLVEQSYHHVYALGEYYKKTRSGEACEEPPDPLLPYNELLGKLFPGYSFVDASPDDLSLKVKLPSGNTIPFQDMSSGEKEVFFILSFFIRHNVSNSVIVIDEPELHLHPELARKLVQLMKSIRQGNQIWLATHSAELIDEAGRERTFFLRASDDRSSFECIPATKQGAHIETLRDMFGYSGYVGISRKIAFTEGTQCSADRKAFVNLFPEAAREIKFIPTGSVNSLYPINRAVLSLLEDDFARCSFFLIRDRDYLSDASVQKYQNAGRGKLFVLGKYHIENYLLDWSALSEVLEAVYQKTMTPAAVEADFKQIAREQSAAFLRDMVVAKYSELFQHEDCSIGNHSNGMAAYDTNLEVKDETVNPLKTALLLRLAEIRRDVSERIKTDEGERLFNECLTEVRAAFENGEWISLFPGRNLLRRFSSKHGLGDWPALQNLVIDRMSKGDIPVDSELAGIFRSILDG